MSQLSNANLLILAGIVLVIPGLVAIATKVSAPDGVKNLVHALISLLAGIGFDFCQSVISDDRAFDLRRALVLGLAAWVASSFAYVKAWKNSSSISMVSSMTESFGLSGKK